MRFLRSKRVWAAVAAVLLLLFLVRPGVYQLRKRIANSIGSALGRRVEIETVHVHMLPQPAFDLEGLVIYDDPAFSAEPMVRAQEVSARIRLSSLLRGRLEIATLSATEPSINLVRNREGRWNLAGLLERSASIPTAPTDKPASERRPAFPYLEATHARLNFKFGQEKKSFALNEADVALWQDSENSWGARLRAQPVRTDFHLTDTGLVQFDATWQRAARVGETPLVASLQWSGGQLGQITQLLSGRDRGWRGAVGFTASLSGTPESLQIRSQAVVDGFRRYDIVGGDNVRLSTECSGRFGTVDSTLADLLCESPVGGGAVRLRGSIGPFASAPNASGNAAPNSSFNYALTLAVEKVPLTSALRLLRQAKKELPAGLAVTGVLDAAFRAQHTGAEPAQWSGDGAATGVQMTSNGGRNEIAIASVPLILKSAEAVGKKSRTSESKTASESPAEIRLAIGPFPLAMGGAAPAAVEGWVSASGYRLSLRGDSELRNVFRVRNLLGVPGFRPAALGFAKVDLSVYGPWQGFAAPEAAGTAQLRDVHAEMRGLNAPIEIASATLTLEPQAAVLRKISAQTGGTHWSGFVTAPRPCPTPGCVIQFDLAADQISTGDLTEWFTPHSAKRPWYRLLSSSEREGKSPLLAIEARGQVRVNRFGFKKGDATQVATQVTLDRGKITLSDLRAQVLQGTHQGNWVIDASALPVRYQAAGTLQSISLGAVSTAMNDEWVTGIADARYSLTTSGHSWGDMVAQADGEVQFTMRGALVHLELPGSAKPFPVHHFAGKLKLKAGTWELQAGKLESHDGLYQVSGTASQSGALAFTVTRGDAQTWSVTGTLAKPQVQAGSRTEAKSEKSQ